jgi:hypothetical protein
MCGCAPTTGPQTSGLWWSRRWIGPPKAKPRRRPTTTPCPPDTLPAADRVRVRAVRLHAAAHLRLFRSALALVLLLLLQLLLLL